MWKTFCLPFSHKWIRLFYTSFLYLSTSLNMSLSELQPTMLLCYHLDFLLSVSFAMKSLNVIRFVVIVCSIFWYSSSFNPICGVVGSTFYVSRGLFYITPFLNSNNHCENPNFFYLTLFRLGCSDSEQKLCHNEGKMVGRYQLYTHPTGIGLKCF